MSYRTRLRSTGRHVRGGPAPLLLVLGAALGGCTDGGSAPTAPGQMVASAAALNGDATSPSSQLSADALGRVLPALEKDAAAAVGNALRELDARLADPRAPREAKERSLAAVESVLAQFTDASRVDAADLDALRLDLAEIGALLRQ